MEPTTVERLLSEIGFEHQRVPDHSAEFNIQVAIPEGGFVHVAAHRGAPHTLVVGAGQRLDDDAWADARRLTRRDFTRMSARLEQLLLVTEVDYSLRSEPIGTGSCVREVSIRALVDESDLSRSTLRRHVIKAHRARHLLRAVWEEVRA